MGKMVTVTFKLPKEVLDQLDRTAKAKGVNRSEALRQAVILWILSRGSN